METRGAGGRTGEWADTGIPLWWARRKHGSNLWYENGWWWCLLPWKVYGECRNWVLDFCTTVWFVSSLNAAGPAQLCHSSSPAVSKIQMKCLIGEALICWAIDPALPGPLRTSPARFAPCQVVYFSLLAYMCEVQWLWWSCYIAFLSLTPFIKASFSPHQMHRSSQSISNTLLAVKVRGFICPTAPVPHRCCAQGKAVLGFIRSSRAPILHQICTAGCPSWSWCCYSRGMSSPPLCQAPAVFEEGRIGWRWWVLWSCWRGIR